MRALVTGSTGLCGRALVQHLRAAGVGVDRVSAREASDGVECVDFEDAGTLAQLLGRLRPRFIFHLSGALSAADPAELIKANCLDAAALIEAILASGIDTRLLVVGSAAEYGPLEVAQLPAREEQICRPRTAYGAAKLAQTRLALARAAAVPVVVARPSNIVGAGMPESLALGRFAARLAALEQQEAPAVLEVGDLSAVRDFIDVADVADLYWQLINSPAAFGQVVNVATGRGVTMANALELLIEAFGIEVSVSSGLVDNQRSGATSAFIASTERLERLIGPREFIPLRQSLGHVAAEARRAAGKLEGTT
jgi:GDP-4-dehydro-6-deoxy-D-mannose reductase